MEKGQGARQNDNMPGEKNQTKPNPTHTSFNCFHVSTTQKGGKGFSASLASFWFSAGEVQVSFLKGVVCSYYVLPFYCVLIIQSLEGGREVEVEEL